MLRYTVYQYDVSLFAGGVLIPERTPTSPSRTCLVGKKRAFIHGDHDNERLKFFFNGVFFFEQLYINSQFIRL